MNYVKITENINISELGLGCWALGGLNFVDGISCGWKPVDYVDAKEAVGYALENGINYFDTADCYGNGISEKYLGQILQELGKTNSVVISSKLGFLKNQFLHPYDPQNIKQQFEKSLKNLKREYIDIYYFHHSDFGKNDIFLQEALAVFLELKREGKIRAIGLSCYQTKDFARLIPKLKPDIIQGKANILDTKFIDEKTIVAQLLKKYNIKFSGFSPFEHGLLLNKYKSENLIFPEGDHRRNLRKFKPGYVEDLTKKLQILTRQFGLGDTKNLSSVCLNFLFAHKAVSNVLTGFRNREQVEMNLKYLDFRENEGYFTEENIKAIKKLF